MSALELTFAILGAAAGLAVAWVCGIVALRLLKGPQQ